MRKLNKILRGMILVLPLALVFSYWPVISFGSNEAMNFELSVPLIWLAVFDVVGLVVLLRERKFDAIRQWWKWLIFPVFVTLSLIWSVNLIRGILTVGVMWLIFVAVGVMVLLKDLWKDERFRKIWWRWFFGSALFVCLWCGVQCILDLAGVAREYSLMCAGCVSGTFGFPHPNGFAIEPQFMGNLLIAPAIVSMSFLVGPVFHTSSRRVALLSFVFVVTLFLVFSRGAIYAFIVGMVFMSGWVLMRWRKQVRLVLKKAGMMWGVVMLAFLFALNLQGIMAQVGPTDDTYVDGVAKALNHLSLGVIDIRTGDDTGEIEVSGSVVEPIYSADGMDSVEVAREIKGYELGKAVFDGYVAESTEIRKMMTENALEVWSSDIRTVMLGVGIGGAGEAMYQAGLTDSPKEIVQNEYVSLLFEIGLVGVALAIVYVVMVVRALAKSGSNNVGMVMALVVAYGISLIFFSGFANALQIYLLPVIIWMMGRGSRKFLRFC